MPKPSSASGQERGFYLYRILCRLLRIAARIFFRNIEVVGRGGLPHPENSAVVFCGNHPNSLLDPVLITAFCGRTVHFAAKDVLFAVPILGFLMRCMGAVPIRRRMDHGGGDQSNDDAFAALRAVLHEGRAMGIFPEGISHEESQLTPLKTGAARVALGAAAEGCAFPVYLVPIGLVYFTRHRFRSSVLIQFGPAIEIKQALGIIPNKQQVLAATDTLDQQIRSLTVNAETWENVWVLDGVRRLYQPDGIDLTERARLARAFNEAYPKVADLPEVRSLYDAVRAYLFRLGAANLDDRVIARGLTLPQIAFRIAAHFTLLFISLPLFIIGAPVFLPIGLTLKLAGVMIAPRPDTVATTKFVLGFLGISLLYAGASFWSFWNLGPWWGLAITALIPAAGAAVIHVIARAKAIRNLVKTTYRVLTLRKELRALRGERAILVIRVQELVDKYRESVQAPSSELILTQRPRP